MARGVFDTCILPSALTPDNCDVFIRALEEAKPEIFNSGNTNIRLESSSASDSRDPGDRISDVVTDDEEVGRFVQVGRSPTGQRTTSSSSTKLAG